MCVDGNGTSRTEVLVSLVSWGYWAEKVLIVPSWATPQNPWGVAQMRMETTTFTPWHLFVTTRCYVVGHILFSYVSRVIVRRGDVDGLLISDLCLRIYRI